MGLIRKQAGFDLKVKIEKWVSEYLTSFFQYTIDDDHRIKVANEDDSWMVIFKLASEEKIEVPDYISFEFNKSIEGVFWRVNIERIVDTLNKYSHIFHNLDRIALRTHPEWNVSENITILKYDDKHTISWVSYTNN